jgi:hypothetical protein
VIVSISGSGFDPGSTVAPIGGIRGTTCTAGGGKGAAP